MSSGPGPSGDDDAHTFADVLDGFALGSGHGRRQRKKDRDGPGAQHSREASPEVAAEAGTGEEQLVSAEAIPLYSPDEEVDSSPGTDDDATDFVRPYAITGGRTKANYPLELETLVSTREAAVMAVPDQIEHQLIMEECRTPHSVAEVAAALRVPLGVARVLISDAADAGLVNVHKTISGDEGAEAHLMLMERVLSGLRRL